MADYGKIRTDGSIQKQRNPITVSIANPTEEQKAMCATLRGESELQYTDQPAYDPETQYVTDYWEQDGKYAVQHWTVHDIPEPEATEGDYENALEELGVNTDEEVTTE